MANLKNEYNSFLEDIQKNIKNPEDLEYVRKRFTVFLDFVLEHMDMILEYRKDEIEKMAKFQNDIFSKMNKLEKSVTNIEKDIYQEDEEGFEIICPYCNYNFTADLDESNSELECPECENIIELDWSAEKGIDSKKEQFTDEDEDM